MTAWSFLQRLLRADGLPLWPDSSRVATWLARRLEHDHPSAAESVREGLDETLTVLTLNLSARLRRSLAMLRAAAVCTGTVNRRDGTRSEVEGAFVKPLFPITACQEKGRVRIERKLVGSDFIWLSDGRQLFVVLDSDVHNLTTLGQDLLAKTPAIW